MQLSRTTLVTVTGAVLSTMKPSDDLSIDRPTSQVHRVGDKLLMLS